jgi:hypothetical protein
MKYYKDKTNPNNVFEISEDLSDNPKYVEITKAEYEAKINEIKSQPQPIQVIEFEIVQLDMTNKILKVKPKAV